MTNARENIEKMRERGMPVIGCFPLYPPLELFHSMGLQAVVLWGLGDSVRSVHEADRHVQGYACSVARHLTQFVIADGQGLFDGLFFYNACDTLRNLPEILRDALEESGARVPPAFRMHVPMVPADQTDSGPYLENEILSLVRSLEGAYGVEFSEERFAGSVSLFRRLRGLYLRLEEAVAGGRVTLADFRDMATRANFMSAEAQVALLEELTSSLPSEAAGDTQAPRVVLSGILPPPHAICRVIDDAGLRVVGNDMASLYRSYARTPAEWTGVADYYRQFYAGHFPCTTLLYTADERPGAVGRLTADRQADALIFVGEKFCEYEYFELPYLENMLKETGVPVLSVEVSIEDDSTAETFRTRIDAFAEMLREKVDGKSGQ